jgi:uncharacterized protein (DUF342 family)
MAEIYKLGSSHYYTKDLTEGKIEVTIDTEEPLDAHIKVELADNNMHAEISLYPAINGGESVTFDGLVDYLAYEEGLSSDLFDLDKISECMVLFNDGKIIEHVEVCRGIPPLDGKDAELKPMFKAVDNKPKEKADGSVDFKDINNIICVKEGEILLTKIPATEGKPGLTVSNKDIPQYEGKDVQIEMGKGVTFNEEDNTFVALIDGHLEFDEKHINVLPVFMVDGDLDYSVGNIDFHETVHVRGDVLPGFSIKAKNILIDGLCQDSTLEASENIIIRTGVKGSHKCFLNAKNDIYTGFVENAELVADNNIEIVSFCYNSKLFSKNCIIAKGSESVISGGVINAFGGVIATELGKKGCATFTVAVGTKYDLEDRIKEIMAEKEKIEKILHDTDEKLKTLARQNSKIHENAKLKQIVTSRKLLLKKYEKINDRVEALIEDSMHAFPVIEVKNAIYDGVILKFYGTDHIIRDTADGGKYYFDQGKQKVLVAELKEELSENEPDLKKISAVRSLKKK